MFQFVICVIAILYIFFDVNYFLRIIFTVVVGRLFEKRVKITEPTTIYGESKGLNRYSLVLNGFKPLILKLKALYV